MYLQNGVFPGLIPLVNSYLANMDVDADTHCTVQRYMKLIQRRASGELLTTAAWLRKEVISHPEYKLVILFFFILSRSNNTISTSYKSI